MKATKENRDTFKQAARETKQWAEAVAVATPTPRTIERVKIEATYAGGDGDQGHDLRSSWELRPSGGTAFRLSLRVHLDSSIRYQSRAIVRVWRERDLSWQEVASLHPSEVKASNTRGGPDREALDLAERKLLDRAAWALGLGR